MKPLILIKHSAPEVVKEKPAREWALSSSGIVRAQQLASFLIPYSPEVIVSSVEPKAIQTAEIIAQRLGLSTQTLNGLHEHDRSKSPYYSQVEFQQLVRDFFAQPDVLIFGSETANQALLRFRLTVDRALELSDNKVLAIVAHGTVIALYAAWLTGCDGYDLWLKLDLPACVLLDIQSKKLLDVINPP